ncbi:C13 family peptidase, partial [Candidatus Accumulibacter vicinus]|uniref:C13 family peptidase n=1 Tax=Candidatus Accumulibacter vicinus TaxID=2954382 RepID=UPI00235B5F74
LGPPASRRLAVVAAAGLLLGVPPSVVYHDRSLWIEAHDEEAGGDFERKYLSLVAEDAFYLQPRLLERELAALKPGRPGVTDLYFVGAAGYSRQDVFMTEVRSVAELFRERFATEGRSVLLINNPKSVADSPIASTTSLGLTLRRIGAIMDRDEDILFLFLTSHGSQDHKFVLDFWPMRFNTLDPRRLRELLDESGIKRRVVVISACYSGGFIDALKDDNTLVITAAAADRNSFGCSNEADFTYFGKAYFDEALRQTYSFVEAFEKARPVIAARESREDFPESDPRLYLGEAIRRPLAAFALAR